MGTLSATRHPIPFPLPRQLVFNLPRNYIDESTNLVANAFVRNLTGTVSTTVHWKIPYLYYNMIIFTAYLSST